MFTISSISKKLMEKLGRKAYRAAYVGEHVRRGIATQIRAMRDQRGWNQGKLSSELGKPQSVVSRLEDPSYGKVTVQTLLEVAATFDVALQIRFVPFSSFLQQTRDVSTHSMRVVSFSDDSFTSRSSSRAIRINPIPSSAGEHLFVHGLTGSADTATWLDIPMIATQANRGVIFRGH
jgi:transcriptional regulator with XRE-family HTH domain